MESNSSVPAWLPEGMDVNSSYMLKIKIFGNLKKVGKDYSGYRFEKVDDSDTQNFMDFVDSIVDKFPHGYQEVVHVHYYDDALKAFPEVKTDEELLSMFHKHTDKKIIDMVIAYTDPSEPYEPMRQWPSGTNDLSEPKQKQQVKKKPTEPEEDTYLANPLPDNEYVGIDEEGLYLGKEPADDVSLKEKDKDYLLEEDSDFSSGSDCEPEEEVVGMESEGADYDKDDPPMTVGTTYPNINVFKLALAQHAVKHEFEYNAEKSDKGGFWPIVQGKRKITAPGGYMLLQC
ncbi:unnamed protein product [Urochloa humidicola]